MKLGNMISTIILLSMLYIPTLRADSIMTQNKLIYSEVGKGQPLILLHAFPADQNLWLPQQEGLKNHFRVITLDLRGFGQSGATDGQAVTMEEYADQVKQLMDQLNIKKAIIGGESMGGYVTLAFLKKYPELTEGLILSNTQSIPDTTEQQYKREATAAFVLTHGSTKLIDDFLPKALSPMVAKQIRADLKTMLEAQPATSIASALRGMSKRDDTTHILKVTKQRVLIITSDQDVVVSPQQSQFMHECTLNSRLVMINNAAHLSNLEQPLVWNKAVLDMFSNKH
ncbi:MAG: alpha/beta hydrolase [Gammaproteobacteria bacterium]|nr:alpha/beta hydrolase [Gammaproteobacteria bacterium]